MLSALMLLPAAGAPQGRKAAKKTVATTAAAAKPAVNVDTTLTADELYDKFEQAVIEDKDDEAVAYIRHAAAKGNKYGLFILGIAYSEVNRTFEFGVYDEQDNLKNFFYNAAKFGITKPDADKAIILLKYSADAGNYDACASLSVIYERKKDYNAAYYWAKRGADADNTSCIFLLGSLVYDGKGCDANPEESARLLKIAVDRGNKSASFILSLNYYMTSTFTDESEMPDWLEHVNGAKAAYWAFRHLQSAGKDQINVYCYFILGDLYNRGVGLPQDEAKAFSYAQKAVEVEPEDPFYLWNLARYYCYGWGIEKSPTKARELCNKVLNSDCSENDKERMRSLLAEIDK